MNRHVSGWTLFVAAVGMMAGLIGVEVSQLESWAITPAFAGKAMVHFASVVAAYVSGQLVPTAGGFKGK